MDIAAAIVVPLLIAASVVGSCIIENVHDAR